MAMTQIYNAGEPDPDFGPSHDGKLVLNYAGFPVAYGEYIAEGPDGKIYIGGQSWASDSDLPEHFSLTRVHSDGTLDSTFGDAGTVHLKLDGFGIEGLGTSPVQLVFAADHEATKILVSIGHKTAGVGADTDTQLLAQLTLDGALDSSFGIGGIMVIRSPFAAAPDSSQETRHADDASTGRNVCLAGDKLYIISSAIDPQLGSSVGFVMRLNRDGSPDLTFNKTGFVALSEVLKVRSTIKDIVVQDGKITVCGWAIPGGALIARMNIDGTFDTTFSGTGYRLLEGPSFQFNSLAVLPDRRIIATGWGFSERQGLLAAYTPDGRIDRTFNQGAPIYETFGDAAVLLLGTGFKDGRIIVSGRYLIGQTAKFVTARYHFDGQRDTAFGNGKGWAVLDLTGNSEVIFGMNLQTDGKILLVGGIYNAFYSRSILVTRLLNSIGQ